VSQGEKCRLAHRGIPICQAFETPIPLFAGVEAMFAGHGRMFAGWWMVTTVFAGDW
jgi:hypothetical protein